LGVRDRQKAIPGWLRNPLLTPPPCVRGDPLPVALPDRSAPALHLSRSVAKFRTDCRKSGKFNGKSEVSDSSAFRVFIAWVIPVHIASTALSKVSVKETFFDVC
jgi:hypothetical protein